MAQIFPTKTNLMNTKKSLYLAKLGYDLMDRKRNILVREMMQLIDKAKEVQSSVSETYAKAYAALKKAFITLGDCCDFAENVPVDDSLVVDRRSVMGVELPIVKLGESKESTYYGLQGTNSMLDEAYLEFQKVKKLTAELAEIENNVYRLADAIKKTQKRANALDNILIPQFENTVKFISDALEEKEREDFSRLKISKKQKEK
ncbi:MAG: V-type ATP synthase subunit D [Acutalibacteraceae bacterium]|nr:V-type ATP synthase subunit D [Oscillospiraceae bacterium]